MISILCSTFHNNINVQLTNQMVFCFRITGSQRDLTGRATPRSRSGTGGRSGRSGGHLHSSKSVDYSSRGDHHAAGGGHGHRPGSRQAQVSTNSSLNDV